MRKFVVIGLVVSFLALCGMSGLNCAQDSQSAQPEPSREPTTVVTQAESGLWKEFKTVQGGFAIDMPGEPVIEKSTIYTWLGPADEFTFRVEWDSLVFMVRYHDYQNADLIGTSHMTFLDSAVVMKSQNSELVYEKMISVARHPGREFKLVKPDGSIQFSRIYLARERLFEITTVLPSDTTVTEVESFFESFRLL